MIILLVGNTKFFIRELKDLGYDIVELDTDGNLIK